MENDPFDSLLEIEQEFYQEGYDAGLADGRHAGLVEGKVFGIEKGYEKALELGRLHGRALVWQRRSQDQIPASSMTTSTADSSSNSQLSHHLVCSTLPKNTRLGKHIEGLISMTGTASVAFDNSDEAVTNFDERISRAQAKAKVIAAIVGESLKPEATTATRSGIEEAEGLNARH